MADTELLCNASATGNLTKVLSLLQNGAEVNGCNIYNRTALQVVKLGHTDVVEALLEAGADPNLRDPVLSLTVVHDAAREGFVDTACVLMQHGANVNLVDEQGNLPLHLAAREGHLEVVRLLIGRTADPRLANSLGYTAGQLAHQHGRMGTAAYIDHYLNFY
uniref:cyclin-dependent kinase 4 inhibitor C n=1 Tax=Monopterus albus TaxID=43700 RepID=UPI0009B4AC8C|nr:cyclin-dependent kinase 4 inhibitor C [Monopterus albus]XP_020468668.1 cyclin-dependent kinase 4 inhibitor C [Monopterus albus]XP_020468669.1 cyclin-dependent kinase 4 inhibitor C [Monopterus albus]XP_020468670.1 cyclin-dependent kinase 4 inhibitor C [Monopterus albus]